MDERLHLAVIVGSTREGRFGGVVADWFAGRVWLRDDFILDVIDLAELELPAAYPRRPTPAMEELAARIGRADAFVVVTPEYNHSFPAALKHAIDLVHAEWRAKPVGFVSYGGISGGLRAVEQLRLVFAELHAVTVRDTVSFHLAHAQFDEHGRPRDPAGCETAATTMLDELVWWGGALRAARRGGAAAPAHKEALLRYVEQGINHGELDVVDEILHPDVVHHSASFAWPPGAAGMREAITTLRGVFRDFRMTAEDVIAEGDRVVGRFRVSGTHGDEPFALEEIIIARFVDGRIVDLWAEAEALPFADPAENEPAGEAA